LTPLNMKTTLTFDNLCAANAPESKRRSGRAMPESLQWLPVAE
jgi:hypothetical protein